MSMVEPMAPAAAAAGRANDADLLQQWHRLVNAAPERPAVYDGSTVWSRAALQQRITALAGALHRAGVREGDVIALGGARSATQVAAWWACWQVGAVVMPMDPTLPVQRKRAMVEISQARWLLGERDEPAVDGVQALAFETLGTLGNALPAPLLPRCGQRLAYVLFTSGSTGTPKGVAVSHAALLQRLVGMQQVWPLGPRDRVLHRTPSGFDVGVEELFWPTLAGAALVCAPAGADLDAARLWACLVAHHVTVVDVVPSLYERLLDTAARQGTTPPPALRWVLCGGEALPASLVARHQACWPGVQLFNVYGPTEAVINALGWRVDPARPGTPPIGAPLPGTTWRLCDGEGRPVPPGERGELWLGGILATGYVGRPDLTAERFVQGDDGQRWYRTGDWASCTADGLLAFHGRMDHQVKLRGARIELGEIEAALHLLDGVRQACVLLEGSGREARLVAWLACDTHRTATQWRALLADHLPAWMRPAHYQHCDQLPLTSVGKVDRVALQRAGPIGLRDRTAQHRRATLRHRIACELRRHFRAVLMRQDIGDDDDFFELGGDSLMVIELIDLIEASLGVTVDSATLFAHPTVRALTQRLRAGPPAHAHFNLSRELTSSEAVASTTPNLLVLRHGAAAAGPTHRTPAIRAGRAQATGLLVCVHPGDGGTSMYLPLLRFMRRRPDVLALAAWDLRHHHVPHATVQAMAQDYATQLLRQQPAGPIHLIGWSAGAVLAYEMTPHLEAAGVPLGGVGMIDPFDDWQHRAAAAPVQATAFDAPFRPKDWRTVLAMLAFAHGLPAEVDAFASRTDLEQAQAVLRAGQAHGRWPSTLAPGDFLYLCRVVRRHCQAYDGYQPSAIDREATLFLPQPRPPEGPEASPWPRLLGPRCRTVITGGEHLTMIRAPFVQHIARIVDSWLPTV